MNSLVLILVLFLLFLNWWITGSGWRESLLIAVLTWNVILVAMTEALSAFHLISYYFVSVSWLIVGLLCLIPLYRNRKLLFLLFQREKSLNKRTKLELESWLFIFLVLIIVLIGLTGLLFEPNSYDSMQYHLPRIDHWIQNRDVAYFPTTTIRELVMSPGSEFVMLHIMLLSESDRFAFMAQWISMIGSVLAATLLARRLGAPPSGQMLAAIIAISIPVGILEASSTLNDYYVAFWLMCFAWFALELLVGNLSFINRCSLGASLGLAILAKSTAFIYATPFLIWLGICLVFKYKRDFVGIVVVTVILTLALNSGQFIRNYSTFENFLGSPAETSLYLNEIHTPAAIISNLVRNVSIHLGSPVAKWNTLVENQVVWIHSLIGMDVNDPRTTFLVQYPEFQYRLSTAIRHELYASNLLHLLLIILCSFIYFLRKPMRLDLQSLRGPYWLVSIGAFFLFSILLKWQPIHSRQQLPFFLYFAPFIAVVITERFKPPVYQLLSIVLLLFSLPWVLFNQMRPLISIYDVKVMVNSLRNVDSSILPTQTERYGFFSDKDVQLFHEIEPLRDPLEMAINHLSESSCRDFGFMAADSQIEYPVWKLLFNRFSDKFRFQHLSVVNGSEATEFNHPSFTACVIISMKSNPPVELVVGNYVYTQEFISFNAGGDSCCTVSLYNVRKP